MAFFTTLGEVAMSKWFVHRFLWLPRIEGSYQIKGLFIRLRNRIINLTTSDMSTHVGRAVCINPTSLQQTELFRTVAEPHPTCTSCFFENWQPDSIMRRLNTINCGRNSYNVNPQFLAVFQKYIYVPYQKDSYGPDITKNHSKIPFIFTTRKVHHRKGPSFKNTPDLWELLAKANPGDYMILRCEISIHIWIYDDICTFVEQYRICTTET